MNVDNKRNDMMDHRFLCAVFLVMSTGLLTQPYTWTPKNVSQHEIGVDITDDDIHHFWRLQPEEMGKTKETNSDKPRVEVSYITQQGTLIPVWNEGMLQQTNNIGTFANKVIHFQPSDGTKPRGTWNAS
jgi:hypothetical protein